MKSVPVLMSAENPDGWKLEELADQLISEVEEKCRKIEGDSRPEARRVFANNRAVLEALRAVKLYQQDTLDSLAKIGRDPGPRGTPRIGSGSDRS